MLVKFMLSFPNYIYFNISAPEIFAILYFSALSKILESLYFTEVVLTDLNPFIHRSLHPLILCFTCLPRYHYSQIRMDPYLRTLISSQSSELILTY